MMVISVLAFVPVRLGAMVLTTYSAMKKTMALSECPTISKVLKRVSGHVPEDRGGPISMDAPYATLVFDGDCAICRSWVNYWQRLTNGRVSYRPYQEAAADFPTIAPEAFERAIWMIEPDGRSYSGAAAAYRVLLYAPGHGGWWWMHTRVPVSLRRASAPTSSSHLIGACSA